MGLAHIDCSLGLSEPPHAWAVIPPDQSISRHIEVLLSMDATILSIDNLESLDQRISRGPFLHVSPSPNGKFLALLTFSGILWVVSADFQREIVVLDTSTAGAKGPVSQVGWCGNDAVLVTWNDLVLLVLPSRNDPAGETMRFVSLPYMHSCILTTRAKLPVFWCYIRRHRVRWCPHYRAGRL